MNILLTNDDGIHAPGMEALISAMPKTGVQVAVAAPATQRSASGHSITLGQRLRVEECHVKGIKKFAVHGTPADCVKFAIAGLDNFQPDLLISGINQGANTGVSVYYSGTISAAREGFINQIPAVAVSLCSSSSTDFEASIDITRRIIEGYRAGQFPLDVMLSINVPPLPLREIRGVRVTKQAHSHFIEELIPEKEHDGKKIFTLAGEIEIYEPDGASDEEAVAEGYISITPLKLDLTDYRFIKHFEDWLKTSKSGGAGRKI